MIASQLDRLREVDPATWEIYEQEAGCFQFDDQRRGWILQAVLQEAISSRGWAGWVGTTGQNVFAEIHRKRAASKEGDIKYGHGDSPTCALLAAYLEAITC